MVEYQGPYQLLRGMPVSEAYDSTLFLSFQVRGGLLMRQAHHWAAMLFVAVMLLEPTATPMASPPAVMLTLSGIEEVQIAELVRS